MALTASFRRVLALAAFVLAGTAPAAPAEEIKLPAVTIRRETPKVGRNDPCPCGSGKKFKNCHGAS